MDAAPSAWMVAGFALRRPAQVMGILNATPDSFSDGGNLSDPAATAAAMVTAGAAWLDLGGESTRPGAGPVDVDQELGRVLPVIRAIRAAGIAAPISIDTSKAVVAAAALDAGADAINDVSAGADPAMFPLAAARRCPLMLMHAQGTPATMQIAPRYADVVEEVAAALAAAMQRAVLAGVQAHQIILDPGIGFGKTASHNTAVLRALPRLVALGRPLLLGVSRKSFMPQVVGQEAPPTQRDAWSHVVHALCAPWCALIRVHDVAGATAALRLSAACAPDLVQP